MQVWNIPFARNQFFTGREDLLEQLHTQFQTTQATPINWPQAISGLGGIGKTHLAIEYAYRYRQEYQVVLWARANTKETLNTSYAEIARLLNLPQHDVQEREVMVQAVKDWLRGKIGWLLILDNADDLSIVQPFLPAECPGHLLLTTRAEIVGKLARRLDVNTLNMEVGALLLLRRAGLVSLGASLDTASPSDRSIALALAKELGALPLALDQAGAYIEETQCNLADYERQYQTRRAELLARRGKLMDDHPEPVATTWSLSFVKVEEANPTAGRLLLVCAFLAPDAIPEELLVQALKTFFPSRETPEQQRRRGAWFSWLLSWFRHKQESTSSAEKGEEMDEAVAILRTYSLVVRDPKARTLTVHPLVQTVLRDSMPVEIQQQYMQCAIYAVEAAYLDSTDIANWPTLERLLPHALACAIWIEDAHITTLEAMRLLDQTGSYLESRAQYSDAEPLYERALAICEQQQGMRHSATAARLNTLAMLYVNQGRYTEAEPLLIRALVICEQQLGDYHPEVAQRRNTLVGHLPTPSMLWQTEQKREGSLSCHTPPLSLFDHSRRKNKRNSSE